MFQKTLLILAIAAACTSVQAQSTPAKKELVARILKVQQPAIDNMARARRNGEKRSSARARPLVANC